MISKVEPKLKALQTTCIFKELYLYNTVINEVYWEKLRDA